MMKTHRMIPFALVVALLSAGRLAVAGSPVIDDINGGSLPGNFIFDSSIENVGWVYVPSFSYQLDGITSTFRAIASPPVATRDVTLSLYDGPPGDGGNLLRSGTFSAGAGGGDLGIMFASLQLLAGDDYFIGFENVAGLGLNIVDFAVSLPDPDNNPNPDVQFQSGWYSGNNFETFVEHTAQAPAGFAAPIIRFQGIIPEPTTIVLATLASVVALGTRRR